MYWFAALAVIVLGLLALRAVGIRAGVSRTPSGKRSFWISKGL